MILSTIWRPVIKHGSTRDMGLDLGILAYQSRSVVSCEADARTLRSGEKLEHRPNRYDP